MLEQLAQDLQRWSMLLLYLAGKIKCIKMNFLTKCLYLFQCIPVFFPKIFFQTQDSVISQFLCNKKKLPECERVFYKKSEDFGGLAFPNCLYYYWSVNIRTMLFWCQTNFDEPIWLPLEEASFDSASLLSFVLPFKHKPYIRILAIS